MAVLKLGLHVKKEDFQARIDAMETQMSALQDIISRYREHKTNLDQFVTAEDSSYERWVKEIDAHIEAAGKAYAALKENKEALQKTVDEMDDFGRLLADTLESAADATKSTVEAAIKVAAIL